jgi:hypothetical protein
MWRTLRVRHIFLGFKVAQHLDRYLKHASAPQVDSHVDFPVQHVGFLARLVDAETQPVYAPVRHVVVLAKLGFLIVENDNPTLLKTKIFVHLDAIKLALDHLPSQI